MPDLRSELAPISEAVTNDIRVEVLSRYSPENSQPSQGAWIFQYTVRITNQGAETVQRTSFFSLASLAWLPDSTISARAVRGVLQRLGAAFKIAVAMKVEC